MCTANLKWGKTVQIRATTCGDLLKLTSEEIVWHKFCREFESFIKRNKVSYVTKFDIFTPRVLKPRVARVTEFCAVNICGSTVWNSFFATLLASTILSWLLDFWTTCASPIFWINAGLFSVSVGRGLAGFIICATSLSLLIRQHTDFQRRRERSLYSD